MQILFWAGRPWGPLDPVEPLRHCQIAKGQTLVAKPPSPTHFFWGRASVVEPIFQQKIQSNTPTDLNQLSENMERLPNLAYFPFTPLQSCHTPKYIEASNCECMKDAGGHPHAPATAGRQTHKTARSLGVPPPPPAQEGGGAQRG